MSEEKSLCDWTKDELFALPHRAWDAESVYDTLLIIATGEEHDSGWGLIAIIGVNAYQPVEIAVACADDIEWKLPAPISYGSGLTLGQFRTDCALKSGALHVWARGRKFKVGIALSSTDITMVQA